MTKLASLSVQQTNCLNCGKTLRLGQKMFCSVPCKSQYHYRLRNPRITTKKCLCCSKKFTPLRNSQKYCSQKCKDTHRQKIIIRKEKYMGRIKKCPKCSRKGYLTRISQNTLKRPSTFHVVGYRVRHCVGHGKTKFCVYSKKKPP